LIPVFDPDISSTDISFVADALQKGEISGNFGSYLAKFENDFANFVGVKHGVAVTNGTTALHLAIAVLELEAGSEVLLSSSTNIATALAVLHNNLVPVPVDSEMVTWNLDLEILESLITPKTKAIIPVHLFGHPIQMEKLMEIAKKHNLIVIEDCAESHGATVNGKMTGSFAEMACFSFYANKIITTGEGGMVVTNDDILAQKLRKYRNLGFGEPRFVHEIAGFNARMTGYAAALGLSQLNRIEDIIKDKRRVAALYLKELSEIEELELPCELSWAKHVYWMFALRVKPSDKYSRDALMRYLDLNGVETRTFFCPMDMQPILKSKFEMAPCRNAQELWETGFYLPSSTKLSGDEIGRIASFIKEYFLL
jgi:perosamine synthetase